MNKTDPFCVFITFLKDNVITAHWVGHSKLRSLDTDNFHKRTPVVDEKEDTVTVNTMKQSVSGEKIIRVYYKKKKKM